MKLNHINLSVSEPKVVQAFLAKYFGLSISGKPNDLICFLKDDNGMVISVSGIGNQGVREVDYPANFHIGFMQSSATDVDRINQQLRADGFEVAAPSRQHGSWTFYFKAPGGFTVEVLG